MKKYELNTKLCDPENIKRGLRRERVSGKSINVTRRKH